MAPRLFVSALLATASLVLPAAAQLSGTVGPTTTTSAKASTKVCNIMDYGGVADASTDNGQAISDAWTACKSGGQVLIPEGDYGLGTWVTLSKGTGVAVNLEGTLYRTGTDSGNMIMIEDSTDIEFYSATSAGAIQGYGYEFHKDGSYGPRILRCESCTDFSIHDIILVDAGQFHLSLDTCTNGEVYNVIIHGGYQGGLDGIDVWGTNIWIHDIEVSNKDVSPPKVARDIAFGFLPPCRNVSLSRTRPRIFWSSRSTATGPEAVLWARAWADISNIEYNYVYTHHSNQMYMIKSNGGSGTVKNVAFNNFMGHSNAYTLDFDTAWSSMAVTEGDGISYSNISFSTWTGTATDGVQRGPIKINCPEAVPCTDITVEDFNVWTDSSADKVLWGCQNAYGDGACLVPGDGDSPYTTTLTVTTVGDYTYSTMDNELAAGYDPSASIAIPKMPASFYPGKQPISALQAGSGTDATATNSAAVTAKAAVAADSLSSRSTAVATKSSSSSTTAATETAAASSEEGGRGGQGGGSWAKGKAANAQITPAAQWGKRSAKFRQ